MTTNLKLKKLLKYKIKRKYQKTFNQMKKNEKFHFHLLFI